MTHLMRRPMPCALSYVLLCALCSVFAFVAPAGCSSSGKQMGSDGGGSGGTTGSDAASDSGVPNDQSCQEIRLCVAMCNDGDQPCADACISRGSAAARSLYQAMAACTDPQCASRTDKLYCGCDQQCTSDAPCAAEAEACIAGATDLVCNGYCMGQ